MSVREADDPELFARIQEQNLLRQYDLLANCVEIGLKKGIEAFDKYMLWSLNAAAVANIAQFGGRFREQPIYVGNHTHPTSKKFLLSWINSSQSSTRLGRLKLIPPSCRPTLCGVLIGYIPS